MVYSTCALSPDENDKVISKLLKKFDDVEILEPKISLEYKKFISSNFPETECDNAESSKTELSEKESVNAELAKTESANAELAKVEHSEFELPAYEKTEFGAHILPDFQSDSGFSDGDKNISESSSGPLYFCLLQKKEI